jgi:chromate transporter
MSEVFLTFLRLGATSFGGPIAHLGYFRREFVERRGWVDEQAYAAIVAFCSVLPGPTSSQVGMLVGWSRAGAGGSFLAWLGFTAPSALAMTAFALALRALENQGSVTASPWFAGFLAGLTAAAAAVVAQAVIALARTICTDARTQTIALAATILTIALGTTSLQWAPIAIGALAGAAFLRGPTATPVAVLPIRIPAALAVASGALFVALVAVLLLPVAVPPALRMLETIVRAGTLVFGGGHVVLPLLANLAADGTIATRDFFAGYGAVQAMPGPLFTFATFLGAANGTPLHGLTGALIATVAIFLPSFALIFALAPGWNALRSWPAAAAALRGANASVVGLLGGTLYHPILTSLESDTVRIAIALAAFALVAVWKVAPWIVVVLSAGLGMVAASLR